MDAEQRRQPKFNFFEEELLLITTPRLVMPYLVASQAQKEITHNDALNDLDFMTHLSVISKTLATPPSNPSTGDTYLIAAAPTGAWSGYAGCVASYYSGWRIKTPLAGWRLWVQGESKLYFYDGTAWRLCGPMMLEASLSWSPGTLAAGSGVTSGAIALSGAALGDFVSASAPYDLQGATLSAYVSAANSVVLRLQNGTAGSLSLGNGLWRVRLQKQ